VESSEIKSWKADRGTFLSRRSGVTIQLSKPPPPRTRYSAKERFPPLHTQDVSSAKRSNGVIGSPVTRGPKVRIGRVSGLSPEPCFPINGIARDPPGTIMAGGIVRKSLEVLGR
jgi:hypothetical protein